MNKTIVSYCENTRCIYHLHNADTDNSYSYELPNECRLLEVRIGYSGNCIEFKHVEDE